LRFFIFDSCLLIQSSNKTLLQVDVAVARGLDLVDKEALVRTGMLESTRYHLRITLKP